MTNMTEPAIPDAQNGSQKMLEFRRGWPVLLASSVGVGCGINLNQYVGSMFVKELQGEFGWTRGQISAAQGALLISLLVAPFIGRLIDYLGVRIMVLGSAGFLALIYGLMSGMGPEIRWYYALFTAQILLGGGTGPIAYTRAINTWFVSARGLALGITLMGVSATGVLAPPILSMLIANYGWRSGYLGLAALLVFVSIPTVYFSLFERADYLKRKGEFVAEENARRAARVGFSMGQAIRRRHLYILGFAILVMTAGLVGVVSQLGPILTDKGLEKSTAALLISTLAASVMLGRVVMGLVFDRYWAPLPAAIALGLPSAGALMLLGSSPDLPLIVLAVALIGFAQGAEVDVAAYFIARYFGLKAYAGIYALIGIGFGSGTALGAIAAGQLYDHFGNYDALLIAAAVMFALAGLIILTMGKYPDLPIEAADAPAAN